MIEFDTVETADPIEKEDFSAEDSLSEQFEDQDGDRFLVILNEKEKPVLALVLPFGIELGMAPAWPIRRLPAGSSFTVIQD